MDENPGDTPTATRTVLYFLLFIVAAAAAVLSFAALRDLALACGFAPWSAPLLPLVIDAGAAAGSLAWLGRACSPAALAFGRALALVLLASSVAGNAVVHALAAYGARPHWALVVVVSAAPPAVLGACVHLAVLVGRSAQLVADAPAEQPAPHPAAAWFAPEPQQVAAPESTVADSPAPEPQVEPALSNPTKPRPGRVRPPSVPAGLPIIGVETAEERRKRQSAEASKRSRRHSAGDHSLCLPGGKCPHANTDTEQQEAA